MSGRYWAAGSTAAEASIEQGWAERYGMKLGDTVTLQMGEQERRFTVTSIRKADWDSFRVNFFLLLNEGAVGDAPYNLITAFHLPRAQAPALAGLTRQYPNISLLDIDSILQRVREVVDRVTCAVQLVMGFSLLAGVLVLLAALQATAGERRYDSAVLRTLGATAPSCAAQCWSSSAHWGCCPHCWRWARRRCWAAWWPGRCSNCSSARRGARCWSAARWAWG